MVSTKLPPNVRWASWKEDLFNGPPHRSLFLISFYPAVCLVVYHLPECNDVALSVFCTRPKLSIPTYNAVGSDRKLPVQASLQTIPSATVSPFGESTNTNFLFWSLDLVRSANQLQQTETGEKLCTAPTPVHRKWGWRKRKTLIKLSATESIFNPGGRICVNGISRRTLLVSYSHVVMISSGTCRFRQTQNSTRWWMNILVV